MSVSQPQGQVYENQAPAREGEELRLALAMRGGVSLAVWIGGGVAEIERLRLSAAADLGADTSSGPMFSRVYAELLRLSKYGNVVVDVLAGASAGGLNGAMYAASRVYDFPFFWTAGLWVDLADVEALSEDTNKPGTKSLMRGDAYFKARLESELGECIARAARDRLDQELADTRPESEQDGPDDRSQGISPADRIDLILTATLFDPERSRFFDAAGNAIDEPRSGAFFRFRHDGAVGSNLSDFSEAPASTLEKLARAARSTSSFPAAFEPSGVPGGDDYRQVFSHPGEEGEKVSVIDGGVLDNMPVGRAIRAIAAAPASGDVRRWLLYLHPSPAATDAAPPATTRPFLGIVKVLRKTISLRLDQESLMTDFEELNAHNQRVRRRLQQREGILRSAGADPDGSAMERAVKAWAELDARRIDEILKDPHSVVIDHRFRPRSIDHDFGAWPAAARWGVQASLVDALTESYAGTYLAPGARAPLPLPALLDTVEWLIAWAHGVDASEAIRATLHRLRLVAEVLNARWEQAWVDWAGAWDADPTGAIDDLPAAIARARDVTESLPRTLIAAFQDAAWDELDAGLAALAETWTEHDASTAPLWSDLAGLARALDGNYRADPLGVSTATDEEFRGVVTALAPLHVRRADGESVINFVRVSGASPSPLWPEDSAFRSDPTQKLAGNQLVNFGAFLKKQWRANDWVWGRADAATTVVSLLTDPRRWFPGPDSELPRSDVDDVLASLREVCGDRWTDKATEEIKRASDGDHATPLIETRAALVSALHSELFAVHREWLKNPRGTPWSDTSPARGEGAEDDSGETDRQEIEREQAREGLEAAAAIGDERLSNGIEEGDRARMGMRSAMVAWQSLRPSGIPGFLMALCKPVYLFLVAIVVQPRRAALAGILGFGVLALGPWTDVDERVWNVRGPDCGDACGVYYTGARWLAVAAVAVIVVLVVAYGWWSGRRTATDSTGGPEGTSARVLSGIRRALTRVGMVGAQLWWVLVPAALVAVGFQQGVELPMVALVIAAGVVVLVGMQFMRPQNLAVAVALAVAPYFLVDWLIPSVDRSISSGWRALIGFGFAVLLATLHTTWFDVFPNRPGPNQERRAGNVPISTVRVILVVVGALVGGFGFGLAHVGAGGWQPTLGWSFGFPAGLALAVALVAVRSRRFERWPWLGAVLFLVVVVLGSWRISDQVEIRVGFGVVSVLGALLIRGLLGAIRRLRRPRGDGSEPGADRHRRRAAAAATVAVVALGGLGLFGSPSADAQEGRIPVCDAVATVTVDQIEDGDPLRSGDEVTLDLRKVSAIVLDVRATLAEDKADIAPATVLIELTDTSPYDLVPTPTLLWAEIVTGEGVATALMVERDDDRSRFLVDLGDDRGEVPLYSGAGHVQISVIRVDGGLECVSDLRIRLLTQPLATPEGQVAAAMMLAGVIAIGGGLLADPKPPRTRAERQAAPPMPAVADAVEPGQRRGVQPLRTVAAGASLRLLFALRVEENEDLRDRDPSDAITFSVARSWRGLVQVSLDADVGWNGSELQISIPARVDEGVSGRELVSVEFELGGQLFRRTFPILVTSEPDDAEGADR